MNMNPTVSAATGKLGILMPGMGAVATTFVAGVIASRKGLAHPTGSLTQTANIRLGKRTEKRNQKLKILYPWLL
jgi:myo-inositol-1-phosphate synthase